MKKNRFEMLCPAQKWTGSCENRSRNSALQALIAMPNSSKNKNSNINDKWKGIKPHRGAPTRLLLWPLRLVHPSIWKLLIHRPPKRECRCQTNRKDPIENYFILWNKKNNLLFAQRG
jgi:hypothetical protein